MSEKPLQNRHAKLTNTFEGGMNQDVAFSKYPKNCYWEAKNFRFISREGKASGVLESAKGNKLLVNFTDPYLNSILYFVEGNDSIFFFIRYNTTYLLIYRIHKDELDTPITVSDVSTEYTSTNKQGKVLLINLGYTSTTAISQAVFNYENDYIQKLYWIDDKFRHLNVVNSNLNDISTLTEVQLSTYSEAITTKAIFDKYIGGNLKYGAYFYTYQLYNINGAETSYAPLSSVIHVYNNPLSDNYSKILLGRAGETSSIGIKGSITIDNPDNYNRIRIVSVYYATKEGTPIINVIEEKDISGATIYFTDTGTSLNVLASEDLIFRNVVLTPSNLVAKNNYLFLGNVSKLDYFDIDEWMIEQGYDSGSMGMVTDTEDNVFWESRAFPLKPTFNTVDIVVSSDDTTVADTLVWNNSNKTLYCTGTTLVLSKEADALVKSNVSVADNPKQDGLGYKKYDLLLTKLGGQGMNVSYIYKYTTNLISLATSSLSSTAVKLTSPDYEGNGKFSDLTNPTNTAKLSLDYDEFYRVGIQFVENETGRLSYVKWIGDFRTPLPKDFDASGYADQGILLMEDGDMKTRLMYAEFTVKNVPDELSWRIVTVPKESASDYANKACGTVAALNDDDGDFFRPSITPRLKDGVGTETCKNPFLFISPDITIGNEVIEAGDIVKEIGEFNDYGYVNNEESFTMFTLAAYQNLDITDGYNDTVVTDSLKLSAERIKALDGNRYHDITFGGQANISSAVYNTTYHSTDPAHDNGYLGTCYLLQTDDDLSNVDDDSKDVYVQVKKENVESRFGGYTYEDRNYNVYVPVTEFVEGDGVNDTTADMYGDCFVGIYEHLYSYASDSAYDNVLLFYFPTISKYNFLLPNEYAFSKRTLTPYDSVEEEGGFTVAEWLTTEKAGVYTIEVDSTDYIFTQEYDFYEHNTAYDIIHSFDYQLPKVSDNITETTLYPLTVFHSDKKLSQEYTDSWLKFINNKELNLDSDGGELTSLVKFRNKLYFIQERSFGVIYSEERQTSIQNNSSMLIAKGDVLEGFAVIDSTHGATNKEHVVVSSDYIYWVDTNTKSLMAFNGQRVIDLGKMIGISSLFNNMSITELSAIKIGFDPGYKELYINIRKTVSQVLTEYYSIIYNEEIKRVVSLIDSTDLLSLPNVNNELYQLTDLKLYKANAGNFNYMFESYEDSSITLIVNPYNTVEFIYEFFELLVETLDSNGDNTAYDIDDLITSITISNSEQTSTIDLSKLKKRFRKIRGNIIRNDSNRSRLKDYYTKITITFSNVEKTGTYPRILLHDIISYFTVQVI